MSADLEKQNCLDVFKMYIAMLILLSGRGVTRPFYSCVFPVICVTVLC